MHPRTSAAYTTILLSLALLGCSDKDDDGGGDTQPADADGDGHAAEDDCDDDDPEVHPDAQEVCDGLDNDCDGAIDDDDDSVDTSTGLSWFTDADGDGHGDPTASGWSCTLPTEGVAEAGTDCDDTDAGINPDAQEICDADEVDEDCDGNSDDADDSVDLATAQTWFADADEDGFGDEEDGGTLACDDPSTGADAFVLDATDCDDTNDAIHPSATEVCDPLDLDEDCDGLADDADDSVDLGEGAGASSWYIDVDEDGFGDEDDVGLRACDDPSVEGTDYVLDASDCDDSTDAVSPAATEVCEDSVDNDCDGNLDETCWVASDASVVFSSTGAEGTGYAHATGADIDGDGLDEIIIGAMYSDTVGTKAGEIFLYYGGLTATAYTPDQDAAVVLSGDQAGDNLGFSVSAADDLDGDGYGEIIAGALGYAGGDYDGGGALWAGPLSGDASIADAQLLVVGGTDSRLGWHVANVAGDLDNDGVDDLVFGAPYDGDSDQGALYLFMGTQTGVLDATDADVTVVGADANSSLGETISQSGDADGDGIDDLWTGSGAQNAGYLFYGPLTGNLDTDDADLTVSGSTALELGDDVTMGDLTGDGTMDLVLGAPSDDTEGANTGAVYVLTGPVSGGSSELHASAVVWGTSSSSSVGDHFGDLVIGDLDNDGQMDLLVGSRYSNDSAGLVGAVLGPVSGSTSIGAPGYLFEGAGSTQYFGNEVSLGDVDGDGKTDLLSGAHRAGASGEAYLFYGSAL